MTIILKVEGLRIEDSAGVPVVNDVSFELGPGEALGLVGESGSGKTTTGLAILGWIRPGLSLAAGQITIDGTPILGRQERELRRERGRVAAYVPQNAGAALNPSFRVSRQITEVLRHRSNSVDQAHVGELLELVNLPSDHQFQRRFPHQLSGGQLQRLGIAVALACQPKVLVLDEPTTGLDVITQALVLDQVDRLRAELGITTISISHDLALVAARTDSLAVMLRGSLVERGVSREVLTIPTHEYTQALVGAFPDPRRIRVTKPAPNGQPELPSAGLSPAPNEAALLAVIDLRAEYRTRQGVVVAADDVGFVIRRAACLALVGESGSGKTTIARCIVGLHKPEAGSIQLDGTVLPALAGKRSLEARRRIQIVFQDPFDSLNPRRTARESIMRPLRQLGHLDRKSANAAVTELLERVHLPSRLADARPTELSGGETQRVAIARALAAKPDLLVCDEITSALDTSVQARVLELIEELRTDLGLALLFISHDLGVVASVADEVLVLEQGVICEYGPAAQALRDPTHPYTRRLLAAAPSLAAALPEPEGQVLQ